MGAAGALLIATASRRNSFMPGIHLVSDPNEMHSSHHLSVRFMC